MKMNQIKLQIESSISDLEKVILQSNSYGDLCRYYDLPKNGKQYKYFREIIEKNNISTNHWYVSKNKKWIDIERICPQCGNRFLTKSGGKESNICCGYQCSNVYFSWKRNTEESRKNKSESIKKYLLSVGKLPLKKIKCVICGKEKLPKRKNQRCCSNKCAAKLKVSNPDYIQKLKNAQRKLIAEGRHKGWKTRNILSYPEKFFIRVLNNNTINFIPNKPFDGYFLDFAIDDKKIDLEIDGKQHKYQDRKESDVARDKTLTDKGWKVYRIEWNSINTDDGKQTMKEKIDKFLEFYNGA